MDFLIGFGITFLLAAAFGLIVIVSKLLPKELALVPIYGMIAIDGVVAAIWYYAMIELVQDYKAFKVGIAASFMLMAFAKAIFLVIYTQKRGLV